MSVSAITVTQSRVDEVLGRLDYELEHRQKYIDRRYAMLDSLRERLKESTSGSDGWYDEVMKLGSGYTSFKTDSAISYFKKGLDVSLLKGDSLRANEFRLRLAVQLPLMGVEDEAIDIYQAVERSRYSKAMLVELYDAGRQMYSYIASLFTSTPELGKDWQRLSLEAQSRLLLVLDPQSPEYKLNQGEYYLKNKEYSKARATIEELLEGIPESDNIYARACHMLSDVALAKGEDDAHVYYLALSAISDVKSATLEVTSLQELGKRLYDDRNVERAHAYLSIALDNAVQCHALARMVQSSEALPMIEGAHLLEIEKRDRMVYIFIGLMVILILLLVMMVLFLRREMQRMKSLQGRLEGANHVKEVYISQFLSLCSIYMDKLNQFCKIATRKINAGKVDELLKMTKSGKFIEEQSEEFYSVFDNAFLHIYPTFVEDVNALLRPEEQIILQEGERLNTDLRILAFMRLGIEESPRIAQMLNFSVNTIYAYRNRLKNRAINREEFESQIMNISSIS